MCANVKSQSNKDLYNGQFNNDYYNAQPQDRVRETRLPKPGDSDYRTYVYNNRRYGTDPTRYNPYNPNINQPGGFPYNPIVTNPLDDQFKYNTVSTKLQVFNFILFNWSFDFPVVQVNVEAVEKIKFQFSSTNPCSFLLRSNILYKFLILSKFVELFLRYLNFICTRISCLTIKRNDRLYCIL